MLKKIGRLVKDRFDNKKFLNPSNTPEKSFERMSVKINTSIASVVLEHLFSELAYKNLTSNPQEPKDSEAILSEKDKKIASFIDDNMKQNPTQGKPPTTKSGDTSVPKGAP